MYVDDTPDNVEALRAKGLPTIVFSNSTNRDVAAPRADNWDELEEMIVAELSRWRAQGRKAKPPAGR